MSLAIVILLLGSLPLLFYYFIDGCSFVETRIYQNDQDSEKSVSDWVSDCGLNVIRLRDIRTLEAKDVQDLTASVHLRRAGVTFQLVLKEILKSSFQKINFQDFL